MLILCAAITGCVSQPRQPLLERVQPDAAALGPGPFLLTSWNVHKGRPGAARDDETAADTRHALDGADLLLLQEACAPTRDDTIDPLIGPNRSWAMATSFVSRLLGCGTDRPTGVITASVATPDTGTALRSVGRELGLTPKSALATTYALSGQTNSLLVVNTHLLNFEWFDLGDYQAQLDRIEAVVAAHAGPVIVAGDLNTRNAARQARVDRLAQRCGLEPVFGAEADRRTRAVIGGDLPLDHVLYRGLTLIGSGHIGREKDAGWSNHNSVSALFAAHSKAKDTALKAPTDSHRCGPRNRFDPRPAT